MIDLYFLQCDGIRSGNHVRVYLVIPLAPEGDPTGLISKASISAILHWQFLTLQVSYILSNFFMLEFLDIYKLTKASSWTKSLYTTPV